MILVTVTTVEQALAVLQRYLKCSAETGHRGLDTDYYHFLMRQESCVRKSTTAISTHTI